MHVFNKKIHFLKPFLFIIVISFASYVHALPIDNFRTSQSLDSLGRESVDASVIEATEAIGGTRGLQLFVHTGEKVTAEVNNNFRYKESENSKGAALLIWDGDENPNNLNASGLKGVSLIKDNSNAFVVKVKYFDFFAGNAIRLLCTIYDSSDNSGKKFSVGEVQLSRTVLDENILIPFSSFKTHGENGSANLDNIGAISLMLIPQSGTGLDITISEIFTCKTNPENNLVCQTKASIGRDFQYTLPASTPQPITTIKPSPKKKSSKKQKKNKLKDKDKKALVKRIAGAESVDNFLGNAIRNRLTGLDSEDKQLESNDKLKSKSQENFVPGRIAVKFKDTMPVSVSSVLRKGKKLKDFLQDKSNRLDEINTRYGLKSDKVRPIFRTLKEEQSLERGFGSRIVSRAALKENWKGKVSNRRARVGVRRNQNNLSEPQDLSHIYKLEFDSSNTKEIIAALAADPNVEWAQPVYKAELRGTPPNDPYYSSSGNMGIGDLRDMWGLPAMKVEQAWEKSKGSNVLVAVVDTGVDSGHPDLQGQVEISLAYNATDQSSNANDVHGHGTFIAGQIAAKGNNGIGIIGIAPESRIIPVKVFQDDLTSTWDNIADGIRYAVDAGASVINLSVGCSSACPRNPLAELAVQYAYDNGVVVVIAAGNSWANLDNYSPENTITKKPIIVGASTPSGMATYFSNWGQTLDVVAPGGGVEGGLILQDISPLYNILSLKAAKTASDVCFGDSVASCIVSSIDPSNPLNSYGYFRWTGTSFSAPMAAGVVALLRSNNPDLTPLQLRHALRTTAQDVDGYDVDTANIYYPGFDIYSGEGVVDAALAINKSDFLNVDITEPASNSYIGVPFEGLGQIAVKGSAFGGNFESYSLKLRPGGIGTTISIVEDESHAITNGILGNLPGDLDYGRHQVILEAKDRFGKIYDNGTEFSLERPSESFVPEGGKGEPLEVVLSGSLIAWKRARTTANDKYDIYVKDLVTNTTTALTNPLNSTGSIDGLAIDGQQLVWRETFADQTSQIRVATIGSNTIRNISVAPLLASDPEISGNNVVFVAEPADRVSSVIYRANITDGSSPVIVKTSTNKQNDPSISGNKILWHEIVGGKGELHILDLSNGNSRKIGHDTAYDPRTNANWGVDNRYNGKISGNYVVYETITVGSGDSDVMFINLTDDSERFIVSPPTDQILPSISDSLLVWFEGSGSLGEMMYTSPLFNQNAEFGYAAVPARRIAVSGRRIAWSREGKVFTALVGASSDLIMGELSPHTVSEGSELRVSVRVNKPPNSGDLTFTNELPEGATFDEATGVFSWVPPYDFTPRGTTRQVTARFAVTDGINMASESMTITVKDFDPAPEMMLLHGNTVTIPGRTKEYTVTATDPEGEEVILMLEPVGVTPEPILTITDTTSGTVTATFSWTPAEENIRYLPYNFLISARDPAGNFAFSTPYVFVDPLPTPPFFTSDFSDKTIAAHEMLSFVVSGQDYDFGEIDLTAIGLPNGATFPDSRGFRRAASTFSWTPTNWAVGAHQITFSLKDSDDNTTSRSINITVLPAASNLKPSITLDNAYNFKAGRAATYNFTVSDGDNDTIKCSSTNLPSGVVLDENSCSLSWLATSSQVGSYPVTITASDGRDSVSANTTLVVSPNRPPVITANNTYVFYENVQTTHQIAISDPDGDPFDCVKRNLPSGALFFLSQTDSTKCELVWRPSTSQLGSYSAFVGSTDGEATTEVPITIQALPNKAPVFDNTSPRSVKIGGTYRFRMTATDPDGDPVTYLFITGKPAAATYNQQTAEFVWTPSSSDVGSRNVTFRARDSKLASVNAVVTLTTKTNRAPTLNAIAAQNVSEGQNLGFTLSGTDPDGDVLRYSATNLPSGASIDPVSGVFSWAPSYTQAGNYTITASVTDGSDVEPGAVVSQAVAINVIDTPEIPATPSNLYVFGAFARAIALAWTDNASNETGFEVQMAQVATGPFITMANVPVNPNNGPTGVSITNLAPDSMYYFRVRSFRGNVLSPFTNTLSVRTLSEAPSNLVGTLRTTASTVPLYWVSLAWKDNSNLEQNFLIMAKAPGQVTFTEIARVAANTQSWVHNNPKAGTWTYYVKALNPAPWTSPSSSQVSVNVPGAIASPQPSATVKAIVTAK
jgi:subtilisin family serine protease